MIRVSVLTFLLLSVVLVARGASIIEKRNDCILNPCPDGQECHWSEQAYIGFCIPGRGSVYTARSLREFVRTLDALTPEVKKELEEKLAKEEIKEMLRDLA
ncbi:uncharacterized protein [Ptychodera flava]|uniref:uncharacterized protein n=1 Tax=Ptychodera flava TaxID=63121 RepID=UPI003969C94A